MLLMQRPGPRDETWRAKDARVAAPTCEDHTGRLVACGLTMRCWIRKRPQAADFMTRADSATRMGVTQALTSPAERIPPKLCVRT